MKGNSNDYMLWVETTPGTFACPKGQDALKQSSSSEKVETTTKDTVGAKTYQMNLSDQTWTLDIMPDLPDAAYTRLETLGLAFPKLPFNIQVRKAGVAGAVGDVVWAGLVYGQRTSSDYSRNSPVKKSFEFVPAASPTTDAYAV